LLHLTLDVVHADGVFIDQPDAAVRYLDRVAPPGLTPGSSVNTPR
jgi:hypothetical protein